jgi:hypothetical protein
VSAQIGKRLGGGLCVFVACLIPALAAPPVHADALANNPLSPSGVTYDYDFAANVVKATVAALALRAVLIPPADPNLSVGQALPNGASVAPPCPFPGN